MNYRYMRVIVFFDLPTETTEDKKEYRDFRKFLIKKGFLMLQESVYCKLALNMTAADSIVQAVKSSKPKAGLVQLLVITEKQFNKMEFIVGSAQNTLIDSDERLVIL